MNQVNQTQDRHKLTRKFLVICISILTILPLAPLINRYIPPMIVGNWNLDLTISIILAAAVTWLILRLFRFLIIPAVGLLILVLLYNQLTNGYGFGKMVNDYRTMVENNWGKKGEKEIDLVVTPTFFEGPLAKTTKNLQSKVNYKDSLVRNFAVSHSLENFDQYHIKYGSIVRILSLFKYLYGDRKSVV